MRKERRIEKRSSDSKEIVSKKLINSLITAKKQAKKVNKGMKEFIESV